MLLVLWSDPDANNDLSIFIAHLLLLIDELVPRNFFASLYMYLEGFYLGLHNELILEKVH